MKGIAVIPARLGSKRIIKKNIKSFLGKPMIHYAIKTATESKIFEKIVVTSDSEEILSIAEQFSKDILLYKRSPKLSDDLTGTLPVIKDVILNAELDFHFDFTCCIYPCVPLLEPHLLKKGYSIMQKSPQKYVLPVKKFESPIYRSFYLDKKNKIHLNFPENQRMRTQDLDNAYYDAGQFYFGINNLWTSEIDLHSNSHGIEVGPYTCVDIDNITDWNFAEYLYRKRIEND